jgi:hypothetical protein
MAPPKNPNRAPFDPGVQARFWGKVDRGVGCWWWLASRSPGQWQYGQFVAVRGMSPMRAHRYSFELAHGAIPPGLFVCHRCDNTLCVRPSHLFLGTPADNTHDAMRKGRMHKGESSGRVKATAKDVMAMRRMWASGVDLVEISSRYGLTRSAVHNIVKGKTWRHLPLTERAAEVSARMKRAAGLKSWRVRPPAAKDALGRFVATE